MFFLPYNFPHPYMCWGYNIAVIVSCAQLDIALNRYQTERL